MVRRVQPLQGGAPNMVRATLNGLQAMSTPAEIAARRGKKIEEITG